MLVAGETIAEGDLYTKGHPASSWRRTQQVGSTYTISGCWRMARREPDAQKIDPAITAKLERKGTKAWRNLRAAERQAITDRRRINARLTKATAAWRKVFDQYQTHINPTPCPHTTKYAPTRPR